MISLIYKLFKPLFIFVISIIIVGKFPSMVKKFEEFANISSEDLAFDLGVALVVLFISIILGIIEFLINENISKIEISILDENKLAGTTPLFLDNKSNYKVAYIELRILKLQKKSLDENSFINIKFPRGITVNFEDYYRYSEDIENNLSLFLSRYEINDIGIHFIPINITLATAHELESVEIYVENNLGPFYKLINFKYNPKKITVKRS